MAEAPRYACAVVPHFAAAAIVRRDLDLRGRRVTVLVGTAAARHVWEVTPEAWQAGIRPGMSATEASTWAADLLGRDRDTEAERAATAALLDAAWSVSPRVEMAGPDRVCLDLAGLSGLPGLSGLAGSPLPPSLRATAREARLAEALVMRLGALELPARVAVAGTRTAARLLATAPPSTSGRRPARDPRVAEALDVRVVPPGAEARALAPLPVALLALSPETAIALERWGIRTLGELAALPAPALLRRLGADGPRLLAEARGDDRHPFVAAPPPDAWREALGLDWEVATVEALAFVLHRQVARLAARLALRDRGATALTLTLRLAGGDAHIHRLGGLAPTREPRTLARLLLAGLERQALPAPVVGLVLEAETVPFDPLQADLFAPPRPSPRELGEILSRLRVLVGVDRVGAPVLADSHRPDAVRTVPFGAEDSAGIAGYRVSRASRPSPAAAASRVAPARPSKTPSLRIPGPSGAGSGFVRRRLVPPLPVTVAVRDSRPVAVSATGIRGPVLAAAGPWRTTGEWWADTAWSREEWDVALADGGVYRLACDLPTRTWCLDLVYD